jgi:hypothetical protein
MVASVLVTTSVYAKGPHDMSSNGTPKERERLSLDKDWVMGTVGGTELLGKLEVDDMLAPQSDKSVKQLLESNLLMRLRPAYQIMRIQSEQGMGLMAVPYFLMSFPHPIYVRLQCAIVVSELDKSDREVLRELVTKCEDFKTALRGQRAGLVVPGAQAHGVR